MEENRWIYYFNYINTCKCRYIYIYIYIYIFTYIYIYIYIYMYKNYIVILSEILSVFTIYIELIQNQCIFTLNFHIQF